MTLFPSISSCYQFCFQKHILNSIWFSSPPTITIISHCPPACSLQCPQWLLNLSLCSALQSTITSSSRNAGSFHRREIRSHHFLVKNKTNKQKKLQWPVIKLKIKSELLTLLTISLTYMVTSTCLSNIPLCLPLLQPLCLATWLHQHCSHHRVLNCVYYFICSTDTFQVDILLLFYFCFYCHIKEITAKLKVGKFSLYVFFQSFIAWSLMFNSLIECKLIFIYSIR